MSSRSKTKLEEAEIIIKSFLEKNNNDPEEAWDDYIKFYLRGRAGFPSNIKGIKDFKRVAKRIKEHEQIEESKYAVV